MDPISTFLTSSSIAAIFGTLAGWFGRFLHIRFSEAYREKTERKLIVGKICIELTINIVRDIWIQASEIEDKLRHSVSDYYNRSAELGILMNNYQDYITRNKAFIPGEIWVEAKELYHDFIAVDVELEGNANPPITRLKEQGEAFKRLSDRMQKLIVRVRSFFLISQD